MGRHLVTYNFELRVKSGFGIRPPKSYQNTITTDHQPGNIDQEVVGYKLTREDMPKIWYTEDILGTNKR